MTKANNINNYCSMAKMNALPLMIYGLLELICEITELVVIIDGLDNPFILRYGFVITDSIKLLSLMLGPLVILFASHGLNNNTRRKLIIFITIYKYAVLLPSTFFQVYDIAYLIAQYPSPAIVSECVLLFMYFSFRYFTFDGYCEAAKKIVKDARYSGLTYFTLMPIARHENMITGNGYKRGNDEIDTSNKGMIPYNVIIPLSS